MTTYQHGQQPDGAPVTYHTDGLGFILRIEHQDGAIVTRSEVRRDEAESICKAFHLAKLAEEAASTVEAFGTDAGGFRTDWLRRYREAVR